MEKIRYVKIKYMDQSRRRKICSTFQTLFDDKRFNNGNRLRNPNCSSRIDVKKNTITRKIQTLCRIIKNEINRLEI